jgi:catechol 2,3-dioxygenase-like lactoylglutathione lyase family enzyme
MVEYSRNPIKPLGVGEVALRVADLPRSIAFYSDILGFKLIRSCAIPLPSFELQMALKATRRSLVCLPRNQREATGSDFGP